MFERDNTPVIFRDHADDRQHNEDWWCASSRNGADRH